MNHAWTVRSTVPVAVLAVCVFLLFWGCLKPTEESELEFEEEVSYWDMPDPAVVKVTATPDRANPGTPILIETTILNQGRKTSDRGILCFLVDDVEVDEKRVAELEQDSQAVVSTEWLTTEPGRHEIVARLVLKEDHQDQDAGNNLGGALVRISGSEVAEPELEIELASMEPDRLEPGGSYLLTFIASNPSFSVVEDVLVNFYIDGEPMDFTTIDHLGAGDQVPLQFEWENVQPGDHTFGYMADLPDYFPYAEAQLGKMWYAIVPDVTDQQPYQRNGRWHELGPSLLKGGQPYLMDDCVGRMGPIAFHPTDPNILYAGAPSGGVFKTVNGGSSWFPLTDKLHDVRISGVAVDPQNPNIVYATTGTWVAKDVEPDAPFFKSTDNGVHWSTFATGICQGSCGILVTYTTSGDVVLYAGTNRGLYRYRNSDPSKLTSTVSEWGGKPLLEGIVRDLAVSPQDPDLLYVSIDKSGLYRTTQGTTATSSSTFTPLTNGLPGKQMVFDIWDADPDVLYASDRSGGKIDIYWTNNAGDLWTYLFSKQDTGGPNFVQYNPFLRIHPTKQVLYYGGGQLYQSEKQGNNWTEYHINTIHVDQKSLEFSPHDPNVYYASNDGGIYRCTFKSGAKDSTAHRNSDLRCTQLFRFSASPSNANVLIAGAQDVNTILYTGQPTWTNLFPGDGNFCLIATANNKVMYAQSQYLHSTVRSDDGGANWGKPGAGLPQELTFGPNNACITVDPSDPTGFTVLCQGWQVHATTDGGATWFGVGPSLNRRVNLIRRVLVQPGSNTWFAGDAKGQVYYRESGTWKSLVPAHSLGAGVKEMAFAPTNPNVLYVLFDMVPILGLIDHIHRIEKLPNGTWQDVNISFQFPWQHLISVNNQARWGTFIRPMSIAGDGYSDTVVYVGTDKGVFRGEPVGAGPIWGWVPYNDGLPLTEIRDLHVDPTSKKLRAATWGRGAWETVTGP